MHFAIQEINILYVRCRLLFNMLSCAEIPYIFPPVIISIIIFSPIPNIVIIKQVYTGAFNISGPFMKSIVRYFYKSYPAARTP